MGVLKNTAIVALVSLIMWGGAMVAQAPAPSGNARNGQTLYTKIGCYECHSNEGQGGAQGPRLGPAPMLAFRSFVDYVRSPRGQMPPYTSKVVSERDLADIYAFLAARPRPPAVESIPLLNR